jgi:hypothetical protein
MITWSSKAPWVHLEWVISVPSINHTYSHPCGAHTLVVIVHFLKDRRDLEVLQEDDPLDQCSR